METEALSLSEKKKKPFWKKHFLKLFLVTLLIISIAWGYIGKEVTASKYEKQLKELKATQTTKLASTLALAIRNAMINENLDQTRLYFKQTLKIADVQKIMLADQTTGEIILSTNIKDETSIFTNDKLLQAPKSIKLEHKGHFFVATPVMGLNTQLAVMIIQVD